MNKIQRKFNYFLSKFLKKDTISIKKIKIYAYEELYDSEIKYAILSKGYERAPHKLLSKTLEKNDKYVELGSGIGFTLIKASKKIGSENTIGYEANTNLISISKKNFILNNVMPSLINLAVYKNDNKNIRLRISKNILTSSNKRKDISKDFIMVKTISINQIIKIHNPTYIFFNIEGSEYDAIMNSDLNSLKKIAILYDFNVITNNLHKEIEVYLKKFSFKKKFILKERIYFYKKL